MNKKYLFIAALMAATTAQAQNVLKVESNTKTIEASKAGQYDRIEDEWKMEKGKAYLISLPAFLDGYYFGPNAQRMKVINYEKQDDGSFVVSTTAMEDIDDFEPGDAYIVTPDIEVDTITHVTPGIKTVVEATAEGKELMHEGQVQVETGITALTASNKVNAIYDIQGRRVTSLRKGETYIINGNKLIIK